MNRTFRPFRSKRIVAALLGLSLLFTGLATGCYDDGMYRVPEGAVIRDPIRTTAAPTNPFAPQTYYFENDYLPNKAVTISQLLAQSGENGEAFAFIADSHTEDDQNAGQTPHLLNYLCSQTNLSRAILCGDVYAGISPDYPATLEKAFTDGSVHYVMGNNDYGRDVTDADLFSSYHAGKTDEIGNPDRHYYYVDSPDNKLRYIVLNCWSDTQTTATDLDVQNEWLKNEALQVEEGWGILVFAHSFVVREWTRDTDLRYFTAVMKPIAKTLLEYDGGGEVLALFHGFRHQDMISRMRLDSKGNPVLDDKCGGIPLISTAADKYYTDKEANPYEMLIDREAGTITEQAFDVVVVDRENGQLHCVRIGAPARDKSGWITEKLVEVRTVNIRE